MENEVLTYWGKVLDLATDLSVALHQEPEAMGVGGRTVVLELRSKVLDLVGEIQGVYDEELGEED